MLSGAAARGWKAIYRVEIVGGMCSTCLLIWVGNTFMIMHSLCMICIASLMFVSSALTVVILDLEKVCTVLYAAYHQFHNNF